MPFLIFKLPILILFIDLHGVYEYISSEGMVCIPKLRRIRSSRMPRGMVCLAHALGSKKTRIIIYSWIGTPKGTRTPDSAVRGRHLNRLTMGANFV